MGSVFFMIARSAGFFMNQRDLARKENDWVLYAYIITKAGGQTSLEDIQQKLNAWKRRNANRRRISQMMAMHKKKGFEQVGKDWVSTYGYVKYVSIWSFNGTLPQIDKRTIQHWENKLSPKGDKNTK
jgi:hypothetical protein